MTHRTDYSRCLLRARALALAAMVEAGGQVRPALGRPSPPPPPPAAAADGLTTRERALLAGCSPRLVASIARAVARLDAGPPTSTSSALGGVRSPLERRGQAEPPKHFRRSVPGRVRG